MPGSALRRIAVAAAGLCAAAVPGAQGASLPAPPNGATVHVTRGATVRIRLRENPSTGYRWRITTAPARSVLRFTGSTYLPDAHAPRVVGSGGTRVWTYRALGSGRATVALALIPPGLRRHPAGRYRLQVRVSAPR